MTEYTQVENMQALLNKLGFDDMDEFDTALEYLEIQEITCGTYNGASDTFTPWDITDSNIKEAIKRYMNDTEFEFYNRDYLIDTLDENEPTQADYETLFFNLYNIYTVNDTKQVFINHV